MQVSQKREKTRICDSYAITARYVTMSALPSPRTGDGAVSGTLALIGTENSQDSATRHHIFSLITANSCYLTEIPRKDQTSPCVVDPASNSAILQPNLLKIRRCSFLHSRTN